MYADGLSLFKRLEVKNVILMKGIFDIQVETPISFNKKK